MRETESRDDPWPGACRRENLCVRENQEHHGGTHLWETPSGRRAVCEAWGIRRRIAQLPASVLSETSGRSKMSKWPPRHARTRDEGRRHAARGPEPGGYAHRLSGSPAPSVWLPLVLKGRRHGHGSACLFFPGAPAGYTDSHIHRDTWHRRASRCPLSSCCPEGRGAGTGVLRERCAPEGKLAQRDTWRRGRNVPGRGKEGPAAESPRGPGAGP